MKQTDKGENWNIKNRKLTCPFCGGDNIVKEIQDKTTEANPTPVYRCKDCDTMRGNRTLFTGGIYE